MGTLRTAAVVATAAIAIAGTVAASTESASATGSASATKPAVTSAAAWVALGPSSIHWQTCSDPELTDEGAQCASLAVPLDYSHPNGSKITLALSRVVHTSSAANFQGVMLVNPGGPGGSGLSLAGLGSDVPNGVGDDYDWIGFDPRGVGASRPEVSCDPNYFSFDRPSYIPYNTTVLRQWQARTQHYVNDCKAKNGPILAHLTTVDSAKDMDSIRQALGAKQINYYGFSYGTYLGQVYSTLYPTHVRRLVLDSNVDPRSVWYVANLQQDVAFEKNMKIWWGWLAKYDSVYHLGTTEGAVEALFYKEQAALTRHPADGKLGGDEWVDAFLFAGYYQSTWLGLGQEFSDFVVKHDAASIKAVEDEYAADEGQGDDNEFAIYSAVECEDAPSPTNWGPWLLGNWATYLHARYETWSNAWFNAPCVDWPVPSQRPVTINGSKVSSALLIDETNDAATPYTGSLEVRKLYPHSSLIALPGGTSHANSLFGDACEDDQIADYLADGTLPHRKAGPGPDATCRPLPVPDPTAASAATLAPAGAGGSVARATQRVTIPIR
jgi:pimeloyl-ACP methyl ester carboxylesterase